MQHIDDGAIAAVGDLYDELGLSGDVLDLCASWVSHFHTPPARLVVLGMNAAELEHNPQASERVVHDLNADPTLPFPDASFDAATCCVSVDYLTQPLHVFDEVARVLRPGGVFVCTFSNRCFPTKAIRGWLASDDAGHVAIVEEYFRRSRGWDEPWPSAGLHPPPRRPALRGLGPKRRRLSTSSTGATLADGQHRAARAPSDTRVSWCAGPRRAKSSS